jgi:hypothetical protein
MAEAAFAATRDVPAGGATAPRRIFWATWAGWMLDGFDSAIYLYVLVPALTELLPASGVALQPAPAGLSGAVCIQLKAPRLESRHGAMNHYRA